MEEKVLNITKLQKELLIKHLNNIQAEIKTITKEKDYLTANCDAMKIILEDLN